MIGADAGVIGPGCQGAEECSQQHPREGEDGSDERAGPASAKISEFRDGLSEEDLVCVALKISQDGRAENRGDDDGAKEGGVKIVEGVGPWAIEEDFAVGKTNWAEAFRRDGEKGEGDPDQKIDVGGNTLGSEANLKCEEFPEHGHRNIPYGSLVFRVTGEMEKIDIRQLGRDGTE